MSQPKELLETVRQLGRMFNHHPDKLFERDHPVVIVPARGEGSLIPVTLLTMWTYARYNGRRVLRLEVETRHHDHIDLEQLNEWVAQHTGTMPFATVRVTEVACSAAKIVVTHSLLVENADLDTLEQVVDGMIHVRDTCEQKLIDLEVRGIMMESDVDYPLFTDPDEPIVLDACDGISKTRDAPGFSFSDEELASALREHFPEGRVRFVPVCSGLMSQDITATDEEDNDDGDDDDDFVIAPDGAITAPEGESPEDVLAELGALVGLEPVKKLVATLAAQQKIARRRERRGMKAVVPSPHLVFTGNPGTGKTTVARLIGRLYRSLGLLSSGHVIEANRSSLVAGYVGQTALKTKEACESARNGVLFVDEAYGLDVDDRDYGREAVEALLTYMESHRGEFVLVVAGYPDRMKSFLESNPGFSSRFDVTLDFPDYDDAELGQILEDLVRTHDYEMTPAARTKVDAVISSWTRDENFGNAREIRKLFHDIVGAQAQLLLDKTELTDDDLRTITEESVPGATGGPKSHGGLMALGYL